MAVLFCTLSSKKEGREVKGRTGNKGKGGEGREEGKKEGEGWPCCSARSLQRRKEGREVKEGRKGGRKGKGKNGRVVLHALFQEGRKGGEGKDGKYREGR
jgi:hypothetical protein